MKPQSENYYSKRASKFAIEECYSNLDVRHELNKKGNELPYNYFDPSEGYRFDYPMRWINDPSQNKMIGIRQLDCIPTAHQFKVKAYAYDTHYDSKDSSKTSTCYTSANLDILSENTLREILNKLVESLSDNTVEYYYKYNVDGTLTFYCISKLFKYQTVDTTTTIVAVDSDTKTTDSADTEASDSADTEASDSAVETPIFYKFSFEVTDIMGKEVKSVRFLKFLNQPVTSANKKILTDSTDTKEFTNVWDRENLEFHATFSEAKRGYIGLKGDFYPRAGLLFAPTTNSPTFNLRFTTDGVHPILPLYSHFIVQLSFILNYKTSYVMR